MAHARIGRVRMKSGGAEVRVFHSPVGPDGQNWRGKIVEHARKVAEFDEPGSLLVGFCVIGLFSNGTASVGFRYDPNSSPIPRLLLPAYIAELLRRDMVTTPEAEEVACHVVNRLSGWED